MTEEFKRRLEHDIRNAGHEAPADIFNAGRRKEPHELVDAPTWRQITELQEHKRDLRNDFLNWRKQFWMSHDGPDVLDLKEHAEGPVHTLFAHPDGGYETHLKGGARVTLTEGDIRAASEWGFWWTFDDSVPRSAQRRIMSHQVRRALAGMYDKQLLSFGAADSLSDDFKRDAYARKTATEQTLETVPDGILAEKMLFSLLTKEMHDGDLAFTVEAPDVYEDLEHKIDLVITIADTRRGVTVGEPRHRIGVQFTRSTALREKKQEQVDRVNRRIADTDVDEVVLVVMPLSDVRDVFNAWRYGPDKNRIPQGKLDPRGPDHLWSSETKQQIVDALVRGIGIEEPGRQT